jgi:hypothetical protein
MDRRENRIRAYQYIVERAPKTSLAISYLSEKTLAEIGYISLDDLRTLKEGLTDPSPQLVATLKKLLGSVASEAEIEDYLVTPFSSEAQPPSDRADSGSN